MKNLLKKSILVAVLVLVLGVTGLIASYLFRPDFIVNETVLKFAVGLVFDSKELTWEGLQVDVKSESLLRKKIQIKVKRVALAFEGLTAQTGQSNAELIFHPGRGVYGVDVFGPLHVEALAVKSTASETPEQEDEEGVLSTVLEYLDMLTDVKLREIDVSMDSFVVTDKAGETSGRGKIHLTGLGSGSQDQLDFEISNLKGSDIRQIKSNFVIKNYSSIGDPNADISGSLLINTIDGWIKSDLTLNGKGDNKTRNLDEKVQISTREIKAKTHIQGELSEQRFKGSVTAELNKLSKYFLDIELQPCAIGLVWGETMDEDIDMDLTCSGVAKRARLKQENLISQFLPARLNFDIDSKTKLAGQKNKKTIVTNNKFALKKLDTKPIDLSGSAVVAGTIPIDAPSNNDIALNFDLNIVMDEFQNLVRKLAPSPWAIPAPINQLSGPSQCHVSGKYRTEGQNGVIPLNCSFDLKAEMQRLVATTTGEIFLESKNDNINPNLKLNIAIENLETVLPDLKIGKPVPAVMPDKRIVKDEPEVTTIEVNYDITVKTNHPKAIILHSNLAKDPVPIALDIRIVNDQPIQGDVNIGDFGVEIYHRKAKILYFTIGLNDDPKLQPIKGRVFIPNNDYKIYLNIAGTMAKPSYFFESDPPLPEQDVLALVLFGRLPDDLDSDKQRSVDETRAAIADKAINLISMYYLASTPIESIGYNPSTKMLAAKFNVQEGLSVTVGGDAESREQIGVKKRLGGRWTVETTAVHDQETDSTKGVAVLRWAKRF